MMKPNFVLVAVILGVMVAFIKPSFATVGRPQTPLSKTILDFEPLMLIKLHENTDDMKRTLNIKFTAFDNDFDVELLHSPSFSDDTMVDVGGSKHSYASHLSRSYRTPDHTVALTLDGDNEGIVRGMIQQGSDIFHIMTSADVHSTMQVYREAKQIMYSSGSPLIIVRDIDMIEDPDNPQFCGTIDNHASSQNESHLHQLDPKFRSALRDRRGEYSLSPPPEPCPTKAKNLNMGFAADHSFIQRLEKAGQTFESWLDTTVNIVSALYLQTFRTAIKVTYMYVPDKVGKPEWNPESCPTIYNKLSEFSKWRGRSIETKNQPEGLFHLMSACYSSGAIGLAWTSVLCETSSWSQSNGWVSGTGVSSGNGLGWTTVAHEIGHNFGAPHDSDNNPKGIMYPYTSSATKFTRKTQEKICSKISYNMGSNKACLTDHGPCKPTCSKDCGEFGCCGDDGCGGSCGTCPPTGQCDAGVCGCVPNCDGRQCGSDGCGGQCGMCDDNQSCISSQCLNITDTGNLYLDLHNDARKKYQLEPLKWSTDLAEYAAEITSKGCYSYPNIDKSIGYNYGIWVWWTSRNPSDEHKIKSVVKYWIKSSEKWTCSTDSCGVGGKCRDYTQIIHEKVKSVGCSFQYCPNRRNYFMCAYDYNGKLASSTPFDSSRCHDALTGSEVCQPERTCKSAGYECGTFYNGCDDQNCGSCAHGTEGQDNMCVCVPSTSCTAEGKTCGTINIGCGQYENCGSCAVDDQCIDNSCSRCEPATSCKEQGRKCGVIYNGCGQEDCGACLEGSDCEAGVCSVCSNCDDMATCENAQCECRPGYTGDGYSCTVMKDYSFETSELFEGGVTYVAHSWWDIPGDRTRWLYERSSLVHLTNAISNGIDVALLNQVIPCSDTTVIMYRLRMRKTEESRRIGVTFQIDIDAYLLIYFNSNDHTLNIGIGRNDIITKSRIIEENIYWPNSRDAPMNVIVFGRSGFAVEFGLQRHKFTIADYPEINLCRFGVFADNYASFSSVNATTETHMQLNLITELSVEDFQVKVAHALGISESQINDVAIAHNILNRRDVGAVGPTTYTFSLTGSSSASSTALASSLTSAVAQQSSSLAAAGLVATSSSLAGATIGAGATALSLSTAGLSALAIAGIVSGGVALVGVTAAGGIYVKKRRSTDQSTLHVDEHVVSDIPPSKDIPTFGVNVMNPDVHLSRTFSLTQRNSAGFAPPEPIIEGISSC